MITSFLNFFLNPADWFFAVSSLLYSEDLPALSSEHNFGLLRWKILWYSGSACDKTCQRVWRTKRQRHILLSSVGPSHCRSTSIENIQCMDRKKGTSAKKPLEVDRLCMGEERSALLTILEYLRRAAGFQFRLVETIGIIRFLCVLVYTFPKITSFFYNRSLFTASSNHQLVRVHLTPIVYWREIE